MIQIQNLVKRYFSKRGNEVVAINDLSIDLPQTGMIFVVGKSGCGKTTLLNVLGALDTFDAGDIKIGNRSMKELNEKELNNYRNTFVGFVFQEYNLLEDYTVEENIAFALDLQEKESKKEVEEILAKMELDGLAKRMPNELSGGQRQRVAIARAIIKNPKLVLCDEPTGSLDYATSRVIFELLKEISKERLVLVVSHDKESALEYGDRIIEMRDGKKLSDTKEEIEEKQEEIQFAQHKLSNKNVFKLAKGFLRKRVGRLLLSLIISIITFILLGCSESISSYNRINTALSSLYANDVHYLAYKKQLVYQEENGNKNFGADIFMDDEEIKILSERLKTNKVNAIYNCEHFGQYTSLSIGNVNYKFLGAISGFIELDEQFLTDYGYELYGKIPTEDDEIVITDLAYLLYKKYGYLVENEVVDIKDKEDMLNKKISSVGFSPFSEEGINTYRIVGILNTHFNIKHYQLLENPLIKKNNKEKLKAELQACLQDGSTHNAVYLRKDYYKDHFDGQSFRKFSTNRYYIQDSIDATSMDKYAIKGIIADEQLYQNYQIFWKDKEKKLTENEVILPFPITDINLDVSDNELKNYILERLSSDMEESAKEAFIKDHPSLLDIFVPHSIAEYILNETKDKDNKYQSGLTYSYFYNHYIQNKLVQRKSFAKKLFEGDYMRKEVDVIGYYVVEITDKDASYLFTSKEFFTKLKSEAEYRWNDISYVLTPITHNKKEDLHHLKIVNTFFPTKQNIFTSFSETQKYEEMCYSIHNDIYKTLENFDGYLETFAYIFRYVLIALLLSAILVTY